MLSLGTWLWVGAAGLFLATLMPLSRMVTDPRHRAYYAVLASVTGIASAAYVVMALGFGSIVVGGDELLVVRYLDWLFTTPLLVLYLGLLCRPGRRVLAGAIVADVVVIATGVAADLLSGVAAAAAFVVSTAAFGALLYMLVRTLPARATTGSVSSVTFTKLRNLTVVLWSLYPVVWLLTASGLGLLNPATENMVVVYLDFISKAGFVLIAVHHSHALDAIADDEIGLGDDGGGFADDGIGLGDDGDHDDSDVTIDGGTGAD